MKRLLVTITIIMFTCFFFPPIMSFASETALNNDYVKIGLKYGSSSVQNCTLKSSAGFMLGIADDRRFEEGMPLPAYTKLIAANENGVITVRDEEGVMLSAELGSRGCIMPADYEEGGIIYYENTPYRGGIILLPNPDGTITVINYLSLEHYVYGVLNSEMGYTNPEEALKAQAVAARSFGELSMGKHSKEGFDICPSTCCQVYRGYSGEYTSIIRAVDETRGKMMYYNNTPITAYYYKNSGGYTQNIEDVWSSPMPYLRAVEDEYSPNYPWSASLSFEVIQTKLEAAGFQPGTVESVEINERNMTGAVSELKIKGSKAIIYLKKEKIRTILGSTIIKSLKFELKGSDSDENSSDVTISNGLFAAKPGQNTYIITGNGIIKEMENDSLHIFNGINTLKLDNIFSTQISTDGSANFSGYGYGHGVGMPQDSAIEMAKQGFIYDEILRYFYTDIEIR